MGFIFKTCPASSVVEHLAFNQRVRGSNPLRDTINSKYKKSGIGEIVDALDLGSNVEIREGASPLSRTKGMRDLTCFSCYYCNKLKKSKICARK